MYLFNASNQRNARITYPHISLDPANVSSVSSIRSVYPLCRAFLSNPLIMAAIWKFSAYPITRIIYDTESDWLNKRCTDIFDKAMQLREFSFLGGLNYHGFGNHYYSIRYPMKKLLTCSYCGKDTIAHEKTFSYKSGQYTVRCSSCNRRNSATARDIPVMSIGDIALTRWDPELVQSKYLPYLPKNQQYQHYLNIPPALKNRIKLGDTRVIANLPESFIRATKDNKRLLSKGGIRHMRRPSFSKGVHDDGLGIPIHMSSFSMALTFQLLMKHLESAIIDHTLPYRAISPKTGKHAELMGTSVTEATDALETFLAEVRKNPNFIGVVPPFDNMFIGGQVNPLTIIRDLQTFFDMLLAGLGFPREFVFGGLSWSGSSVSLRILENAANDYRAAVQAEIQFTVSSVLRFLGLPQVDIRLEKFKMADDLQRAGFDANLAREGTLSWETVLEERDHDPTLERERVQKQYEEDLTRLRRQRTVMARAAGEATLEGGKFQAKHGRMMALAQFDTQAEIQRRQIELQKELGPPPGQEQLPPEQGPPPGQGPPPAEPSQAAPPQEMQGGAGAPGAPGAPAPEAFGGGPSPAQLADSLMQMSPYERRLQMANLRAEDWGLYRAVAQKMEGGAPPVVPLPEQKPPQRGPETALV